MWKRALRRILASGGMTLAAATLVLNSSMAEAQRAADARSTIAPSEAETVPATSPLDAWQAPTLTTTRFDENWNALADPAVRRAHWTGRFKYIALPGDAYLTTGVELRARDESYHGNGWGGAAAPDDGYLWLRALPYVDVHAGSGTIGARAFFQPMATYAIGVRPAASGIDQSRLDVLQAFGDVRLGRTTGAADGYGATLRYGRQMMSLGSERLVGTRYGINVPLAYDGFRAFLSLSGAMVTLLAVRPVTPGTSDLDDHATHGRSLWGAYATLPGRAHAGLDVYYLGYRNVAAAYGGVRGRELRHTLGARLFAAPPKGWHYDVEGMAQFGRFEGSTIAAWAIGAEVGRRLMIGRITPDLTLRADAVSGDRSPGDRRLGTFDPLFPKGKYFGELSPIGPANIMNLNPRLTVPLAPTLSAGVMAQAFWRTSLADGIYAVSGALVRAPSTGAGRFVGKQFEGVVSWQATRELALSASLSAFDPGGFIRETGPARTITLLGTEANFRF